MLSKSGDKVTDVEQGLLSSSSSGTETSSKGGWGHRRLVQPKVVEKTTLTPEDLKLLDAVEEGKSNRKGSRTGEKLAQLVQLEDEGGGVGGGGEISGPKKRPTSLSMTLPLSPPPSAKSPDSITSSTVSPDTSSTTLLRRIPGFNGISLLHGHFSENNNNSINNHHVSSVATNGGIVTASPKLPRFRMSSKFGRVRKRVVFKNGECNLHQTNISKRRRRYLADIFTTLVDIQWRWTLLVFTLSFLLSWLSFAMVWWLISFTHGDLELEHLPGRQEESNWKPCVGNFYGFTSAFLFSIETQHTIGYGSRYTTEECPVAVFVMCMQSILGVMIQAFMVGVVFAKMSRPKKRTQTLMFSRHGVICQRDGQLCLMFRVGDMRRSHIISANVRAQLIKRRVTAEGEVLPFYQHELKVGVDSDQSDVFFIWPMIVVHRIDKDSPLYETSAEELLREKFEIVLILEGVIESTGATTQARTSYLPSEILWGHRFESLVGFRKDVGEYTVDYSSFNNTYEVETPLCSAKDLDDIKSLQNEVKQKGLRLLTPFRIAPPPLPEPTPAPVLLK